MYVLFYMYNYILSVYCVDYVNVRFLYDLNFCFIEGLEFFYLSYLIYFIFNDGINVLNLD